MVMVLDLLPFKRHKTELFPVSWWGLHYVYFGLSLGQVATLWWGGYCVQEQSMTELCWLLGGNLFYDAIGIAPFCPAQNLWQDRKCTDCNACNKMCPMDINVLGYLKSNSRCFPPNA